MTTQIFNGQGFLTVDGKAFINDGFVKELKKVIATADNAQDLLIISCILKSIVGETITAQITTLNSPTPPTKSVKSEPQLRLIKSEVKNNVIPFPGNKAIMEIQDIMSALSDYPLMV